MRTRRARAARSLFQGTDDICVDFGDPAELTSAEAFAEPFIPVFSVSARTPLPHLRPLVFGLMAKLEAVQLGGVLITRVPGGQQVKPHDDRGRWHPESLRTSVPSASEQFASAEAAPARTMW